MVYAICNIHKHICQFSHIHLLCFTNILFNLNKYICQFTNTFFNLDFFLTIWSNAFNKKIIEKQDADEQHTFTFPQH